MKHISSVVSETLEKLAVDIRDHVSKNHSTEFETLRLERYAQYLESLATKIKVDFGSPEL